MNPENEQSLDAGLAGTIEKTWRRRCLSLLLVLLPLTACLTMYDSTARWLGSRDLFAREVAAGSHVNFGGAQWQLRRLLFADAFPVSADVPAHAVPVIAEFSVVVQDTRLQELWQPCRIFLEDDQGRHWAPTSLPALRLPAAEAGNCISGAVSGAAKGSALRIREVFLIPRDAAAAVQVTVGLGSESPRYLRFERPNS